MKPNPQKPESLRVLLIEDSERDAELMLSELEGAGYHVVHARVETAAEFRAKLEADNWDIVLADYSLPRFSAPGALALLKEKNADLPFIVVSGSIGEETAVSLLKSGASDYVMKGKLVRLVPAVERELREAGVRLERRQAEAEVRESREQLRALAARMDAVREEERKRIAREIHDEFGATLTGMKLDLVWMRNRLEAADESLRGPLVEKLDSLRSVADTTVSRVRELCSQLRPPVLDDLGLVAALKWQTEEFERRTRIRTEATLPDENLDVPAEAATAVFRVFQEILTNVARHAHASKVRVALRPSDNELTLEVSDNGRGIREQNIAGTKSLGLLGIRERVALFNGSFTIEGKAGKGTKALVSIPLPGKKVSAIAADDFVPKISGITPVLKDGSN